ncbi:Uncharacterised protein [Legionella steigerwaltii]|uniref:Uncharacterized protein n=2 Tax=Legionella steigerwaltii TaxID=460 RepID=A0A378LJ06_9GAMM|nr:hypothetical protein Lstg_3329 [Legionella steigerwaltii]STY24061.1 Uncharacterised protein [Legionella steigerwaltii]
MIAEFDVGWAKSLHLIDSVIVNAFLANNYVTCIKIIGNVERLKKEEKKFTNFHVAKSNSTNGVITTKRPK